MPTDVSIFRSFLGLANYYQQFISNYATTAYPLTKLLRKRQLFEWTDKQQESLDTLKQLLISKPIVQYSNFRQEFILATDASNYGLEVRMPAKTYFENVETRNSYIGIVFTMPKLFDTPKTL